MKREELEYDIANLLTAFDEQLPLSDEERGIYWFKFTRSDGISIVLSFSVYERTVSTIIRCNAQTVCSHVRSKKCTSIKTLSPDCLEIICEDAASMRVRSLLCLSADNILELQTD